MYATTLRDDYDVTRDAKECNLKVTYYNAHPPRAQVLSPPNSILPTFLQLQNHEYSTRSEQDIQSLPKGRADFRSMAGVHIC